MLLGTKPHTAGNGIRYEIDYSDWLEDGMNLTSATVSLSALFAATITDITISGVGTLPSHRVVFVLSGGSANENFTLDVKVTDSRGEIKNDTVGFSVVAP